MRRHWINRRPKPLFLWLSACTIIRGRELRELSAAQLSQPGFFSNWSFTTTLRKCIWRTCLGAGGMPRQWQRGRGRRDGLCSFMSWNTKSRQLLVCTPLWYWLLFTRHKPELSLLSFFSTISGGSWCRVTGWCDGKSQGRGQPDLASATPPSSGPQFPRL